MTILAGQGVAVWLRFGSLRFGLAEIRFGG